MQTVAPPYRADGAEITLLKNEMLSRDGGTAGYVVGLSM